MKMEPAKQEAVREEMADRQQMKKEIMSEIRHEERRRKMIRCLGCLTIEIAAILIPAFILAAVVAKTGLVTIPWFTDHYYRAGSPSRSVVPLVGSNAENVMRSVAGRAKYNPNLGTMTLTLKEAEVTTILQDAIRQGGSSLPLDLKSGQIAIDKDTVEFFLKGIKDGREVTVKVKAVPTVEDAKLRLEVKELTVGALDLPSFMNGFASQLLDTVVAQSLTESLEAVGTPQSVELDDGEMRISVVQKLEDMLGGAVKKLLGQ